MSSSISSMCSTASKVSTDILTQLANVLPTGTFLVFQLLVPLATNNGNCHTTEKVVTIITLTVLSSLCCLSCFTDSYKAENGVLYYGVVTSTGLWNPNFRNANITGVQGSIYIGGGRKYILELDDFMNAAVSVTALATLSLLTAPVTTCLYPNVASSIVKTVPLLVGLVVSVICAFGTNSRHGIGFALSYGDSGNGASLLMRSSSTASSTV